MGVTVRTIQYYDQKGLLHPSSKSEQNQRLYSTDDEERLYRILTLKFLGFSLTQIKEAEGIDDCQKLSGALDHRMYELERESMEILRNINHHQQPQRAPDCKRERAVERLRPSHQRYAEP